MGEEALAIALYCSLVYQQDFEKGVVLAINHDSDMDSTGVITGNILGLLLGKDSIPLGWCAQLELAEVIKDVGYDLYYQMKGNAYIGDEVHSQWSERYPTW